MPLHRLPAALVGLRFAIAPLLLLNAMNGQTSSWFLWGYSVAVLSDIFDGVIARRLNVSTARLRQADGWADVSLYLCIAASVWWVHPEVIQALRYPLLIAVAAQLLLFTTSLLKFGRFPSFHTYSAKLWGITLFIAVLGLFCFNSTTGLWLAIGMCWINSLEELLMTLILPQWTHDVLSLLHAYQLRRQLS